MVTRTMDGTSMHAALGPVADRPAERLRFDVGDEPSPEFFRAIAETSVNPFAIVDDAGVFRWVGWSIEELLGWRPDELVGKTIDAIIAPASLPHVVEAFLDLETVPPIACYPRGGVGLPADLLCRDGTTMHCNLLAATPAQTGLPYHLVFARRAGFERALDLALEAIAEHATIDEVVVHLVASLEQSVPRCVVAIGDGWQGDRFATVAGDGVDLMISDPRSPWAQALATGEDVVVDTLDALSPSLAAVARARGMSSCWVHPVTVPGETAPAAALIMWRENDGAPTRFTWNAVHRTGRLLRLTLQWDRSHRALEFAATHDTLTGLANRTAFIGRLAEIAKLAEGEAAVLFIDLDQFKPVNDQLGHLAGDRLLQTVADRLAGTLRPGDLVARLGGDEFAVLCERVAHRGDVVVVAERLLTALAHPVLIDDVHEVRITASIGVTELGPSEDPETILARADNAMRAAKARGRARWVVVPPPLA
jgi:diguanylate cyclase (GGDEF)-like protein/PAS domain S-box-containing protein